MDNFWTEIYLFFFWYEKVVSNFCHRESKSEFAKLRLNFRTKDLDVNLEVKSQKPRRCDKLHIAVVIPLLQGGITDVSSTA